MAERKGSVFGESQDNFVWIPITHLPQVLRHAPLDHDPGRGALDGGLRGRPRTRRAWPCASRRHLDYAEPDDFNIETGESVMELWQSATRGIYVVDDRWSRPSAWWSAASW